MNSLKKLIVCICLIFVGFQSVSQDLVVKKNGDDFSAKILEVGPNYVKYRLSPPGDTTITNSLLKSEIFYIKYASGFKEIFDNEKPVATPAPAPITNPSNTTTPTQAPNNYKYQYQAPQNARVYQDPSLLPIRYDGHKYYQGAYRISETQVKYMLESRRNAQVNDLLQQGISIRKGGTVLRIFPTLPLLPVGGLILLAAAIDTGSDASTWAAIGGVMAVGGIACIIGGDAIRSSGNKKISRALEIYNNTIPH